jgi:hypothetical protein
MADRRRAPGHASAWQADPWRTAQLLHTLVSGDRTGQVLEATSRGIQRVMKRETGSETMVIFTSSGRAGECIHLTPSSNGCLSPSSTCRLHSGSSSRKRTP